MRTLTSALVFILANAVGLLLAVLLISEFKISFTGFVFAVLLLSVVEALSAPLINRIAERNVPALQGGVALVTTFVGLGAIGAILSSVHIGGLTSWLAATLLVWLGALAANILLPMVVFKKQLEKHKK